MPSLEKREAERQFVRTMKAELRLDGDQRRFRFYLDGRLVVATMGLHSGETPGSNLVALMARQLKLPVSDLVEYVRCTLSAEHWTAHLERLLEGQGDVS